MCSSILSVYVCLICIYVSVRVGNVWLYLRLSSLYESICHIWIYANVCVCIGHVWLYLRVPSVYVSIGHTCHVGHVWMYLRLSSLYVSRDACVDHVWMYLRLSSLYVCVGHVWMSVHTFIHFCTYVSFYSNGSVFGWLGSELTQEQMSEHKRRRSQLWRGWGIGGFYPASEGYCVLRLSTSIPLVCSLSDIYIHINKCCVEEPVARETRFCEMLTLWQHVEQNFANLLCQLANFLCCKWPNIEKLF